MIQSNPIAQLKERGQVQDITDEAGLISELDSKQVSFYCGFDPTADSLHVGSLLPLTVMKRLIKCGHRAIAVLGTSTGMIGDPSGKSEERTLVDEQIISQNAKSIEKQIYDFFGDCAKPTNVTIVKNGDWLSKLGFIEVLRDTGKHFSVNQMIAKDSVKSRLSEREQGISFTEFSYMILQAIDFHHLFVNLNCQLQIGGSDQWGNITAGIDLIRKKEMGGKSFGLTIPLLMNASGKKFGKTEAGNIWLSEKRTSPYSFYQFWLNSTDEDVESYLKLFTEIPVPEIKSLMVNHFQAPEKREAQRVLADVMTSLIHGEIKTVNCQKASSLLFSNKEEVLDANILYLLESDIPTYTLTKSQLNELSITEFLTLIKVTESKSAARKLIENGGVSINNVKQNEVTKVILPSLFLDGKIALVKIGKKNYVLAKLT